jgi:hypothetical protein
MFGSEGHERIMSDMRVAAEAQALAGILPIVKHQCRKVSGVLERNMWLYWVSLKYKKRPHSGSDAFDDVGRDFVCLDI